MNDLEAVNFQRKAFGLPPLARLPDEPSADPLVMSAGQFSHQPDRDVEENLRAIEVLLGRKLTRAERLERAAEFRGVILECNAGILRGIVAAQHPVNLAHDELKQSSDHHRKLAAIAGQLIGPARRAGLSDESSRQVKRANVLQFVTKAAPSLGKELGILLTPQDFKELTDSVCNALAPSQPAAPPVRKTPTVKQSGGSSTTAASSDPTSPAHPHTYRPVRASRGQPVAAPLALAEHATRAVVNRLAGGR